MAEGCEMKSYHRILIGIGLLMLLIGCSAEQSTSGPASKEAPANPRIKLVLNWYPEAEHGGFYAALVHGIYKSHGIDVEIVPGGKGVSVAPELELGRAQFGIGNADDVLMARSADSSMVALMAPLQDGPRCIMVREDSDITSFQTLKNVKLQIDSGRPYVPFLKSKSLLDSSVQIVPYYGTVAELVSGPGVAQQAYSFSEPLLAEQQGVKVRNLMLSEIGYNPYACCLVATEEYVQRNPELVKKMVVASIEGWQKYLESPQETNAYILKQNEKMTAEALAYGVEKLKALCIPEGFSRDRIGQMTLSRWQTLRDQLVSLELIDGAKAVAERCFNDRFLQRAQEAGETVQP
jgi:NitT/TauT family transport system substrate-binding protein